MKKLTAIGIAAIASATLLGACNDSDYEYGEESPTGVAVYSFKIQANNNILANLDSVFFSINLVDAKIFNADSLPYGTRVNKLVPSIKMYENISQAQLIVRRANGTDTIHDYLTNPGDSIDFSNGPVSLHVVSADGMVERDYSISVNVHKLKSDSLVWNLAARRALPGTISAPAEQHTTADTEAIYTLTRASNKYSIAYTANPYDGAWTDVAPALPAGAIVSSFTAGSDKLYILANDNTSANSHALYSSVDKGASWNAENIRLTNIYGACNGKLAANVRTEGGEWKLVDIEAGTTAAMPDGMPVSGTSNPAVYTVPNGNGQQLVLVGGTDATGAAVGAAWGFDGSAWARISAFNMAWAGREMVVVPFVTFRVSNTFQVTTYPTLIAFGGLDRNGKLCREVYTSADYGITWQLAPELMQLPAEIPSVYGAQAFVYSGTLRPSRSTSEWTEIELSRSIPANAFIGEIPVSRVTRPVTEWDCPFIFMFGGRNEAGATYPYIWRATFNRLTFQPLY